MIKNFNCNGNQISVDFSKILNNGSGVLISSSGTSVFCCLDVDAESSSSFKDLSINLVERFGIINKIPGNYKKKDLNSDIGISMSKMIDRVVRPMIRDDLANSVKLTFYILSYSGYSIESLAVLGASLLLNIAKISNDYFSLFKITNNGINIKDSFSDKFRMYHGIASGCSLVFDFENLDESIDSDNIVASYSMSVSISKELDLFQKSVLQAFDFKLNYFYIYRTNENTNSSEVSLVAQKMFEAIFNQDNRNINKFNQLLSKQNYYFNYLVAQEMKQLFIRGFNSQDHSASNQLVFEKISDNSVLTSFLDNKVFSTVVRGDNSTFHYSDSVFGNIKNHFLVQFHEGSHMNEMNGFSRHELNNANFIKKSLFLFLERNDIFKVSSDVLVDAGASLPCSVRSVAYLLNIDVKSFSIGMSSDKKDKLFLIKNKYDGKIFSDIYAVVSGNHDVISAISIDCSKIFFNCDDFVRLLNFYFESIIEKEKVRLNIDKTFKIEVNNEKQKIQNDWFQGDEYLSIFDMQDKKIEDKSLVINKKTNKSKANENIVKDILLETIVNDVNENKQIFTIFNIESDKVGLVIGKKCKMIRKICQDFQVKIDIDSEGKVSIVSIDMKNNLKAMQYIVELLSKE